MKNVEKKSSLICYVSILLSMDKRLSIESTCEKEEECIPSLVYISLFKTTHFLLNKSPYIIHIPPSQPTPS